MAKRKSTKESPVAAAPSTIQLGLPGLDFSHGEVYEESNRRLRGSQAALIYEEMATNDATIGAALYSIEGHLRRIKWRVVAADDSPQAKQWADFVDECRHDMDQSWDDFIGDILSMLIYGYSLHEIVYKFRRGPEQTNARFRSKYDDGLVGWRAIACRAQKTIDSWDIDESTGEILGAVQKAPPDLQEVYLPMARCVLFRTKSYKNNPEGASVLRRAYRAWHFKKRLEEVEAIGLARNLTNLPKMTVPARIMSPNASAAEQAVRAQFQRMVSLLSKDQLTGLVLPAETEEGKETGYKFELIGASGTPMPADPVIRRYDSRILMSLSSEFLLLGTEKTGSFALASEKSGSFVSSLEWYADTIGEQINRVCIANLMKVNGVPPEYWPTLDHDPIAATDVKDLGLFLSQAAAGGFMTPTLSTENRLRERASLPLLSEDEYEDAHEGMVEEAEPAQAPDESMDDEEDDEDLDEVVAAINTSVPDSVQEEARRGLAWVKEFRRGGTSVGRTTARMLASNTMTRGRIRRMARYFPRHEVDKQGQGWSPGEKGYPSNGRIAWALWGGEAGKGWSNKLVNQMNREEE